MFSRLKKYSGKARDVTSGKRRSKMSADRMGETCREASQCLQDPSTVFFFLKERRDYLEREALPLHPSEIRLLIHEQRSQSLTQGHACADRFWTHQVLLQG